MSVIWAPPPLSPNLSARRPGSPSPGPLSHRQRKQVYMHSEIFQEGGPSNRSIYSGLRQEAIGDHLRKTSPMSSRRTLDATLPSPSDMRQTHNAGHGVVQTGPQPVRSDYQPTLVNGQIAAEPLSLVHGHGAAETIPKEFRTTHVKLSWSDPRNELCTGRHNTPFFTARRDMDSAALKRQEMSSELFGTTRMLETSGAKTSQSSIDLRSSLMKNFMGPDSHFDPLIRHSRRAESVGNGSQSARGARDCLKANLGCSDGSQFADAAHAPTGSAPVELDANQSAEDSAAERRRHTEKNFSNLFGHQMGERRKDIPKEEHSMLLAKSSSRNAFLDHRCEVARRKRQQDYSAEALPRHEKAIGDHIRHDDGRKLFPNPSMPGLPGFPQSPRQVQSPQQRRVCSAERPCYDTVKSIGFMDNTSELARRARTRHAEHSDLYANAPAGSLGAPPGAAMERKRRELETNPGFVSLCTTVSRAQLERDGSSTPRSVDRSSNMTPRSFRESGPFSSATHSRAATLGIVLSQAAGVSTFRGGPRVDSRPETPRDRKLAHNRSTGIF